MSESQNRPEPGASDLLAHYLIRPEVLLPLVGLATFVIYSGSLSFEFVWDDLPQIVNNPVIRSWRNLPQAFGSDLWYHAARTQVYYRPLFVMWSMFNFMLFGLRPWGWHLGAVVLHITATLSVFSLARKLGLEYWTAALASLMFGLHPIHIEPVAWVSAASDSMVTVFVALAFVAYLNARSATKQNKTAWRLASYGLLMCALLTKEMAVAFTALVAVYAWLNPGDQQTSSARKLRGTVIQAIPYATVTLAYVLLRHHALLHSGGQFDTSHGAMDEIKTLPLVLAMYLRQLSFPIGLTGLYYTPYVTTQILRQVVLPSLVLALALTGLWYWERREKDSTIAFAAWWLVLSLAPALYLPNFRNGDFVRDRYIYLPSVGFAILAARGLRQLPRIRTWSAKTVSAKSVQVTVAVALCSFYMVASVSQQVYWGNGFLVLLRGQSLYPHSPSVLVGLANEYSERGANEKAIELAQRAFSEHPDYVEALQVLAETNIRAGHFEEGRKWLDRFLVANPNFAKSETGMAALAGLYGQMGDYNRALAYCGEILAKDPNLYSALYNCGNIHMLAGKYAAAERLLSHAIDVVPQDAAPKHYLGRALLEDGKNQEAQPYLEQAVSMNPRVWDYHYWLARSFERSGNIAAARAEYYRALQLNQDSTEARLRLAALEEK